MAMFARDWSREMAPLKDHILILSYRFITVPPGRESGDTRRPYRTAGGKRRLHREVRCSKRIYPDFQGTCMGKNCAFLSRAALEIRSFSQVKPHLYIGSKKTLHISKQ